MDYARAGYIIEYRTRNSSQINVAITTGRPRVLYRSIISPSITRIDLSRAASFVCRPGGFPEQMIPSHGSHFTFSRAILSSSVASVDFQGFASSKRKHLSTRGERISWGWVLWCGRLGEAASPLNSSSRGGYYFPR